MSRGARSLITMLVLLVILVAMTVWAWQQVTAPLPSLLSQDQPQTCQNVKQKKRISRDEIQVSVYNASNRRGLAGDTLAKLEKLGFSPGEVGNAPTKVKGVEIWTDSEADGAALLLAKQLQPRAKLVVTDNRLGPGTDLVIGKGLKNVKKSGPRSIKLKHPQEICLD